MVASPPSALFLSTCFVALTCSTLTREDTVNYDRTRMSRMKTQRYSFYDVALEEQHETFAPMDRRRDRLDTSH